MEYRKLPHGEERIGVLGLGLGGIQKSSDAEIAEVIHKAMENGVNYFDMCCGAAHVYAPFGEAIAGKREKVYLQMHFGVVYNEKGDYAWSRDAERIRKTFDWERKTLHTDYADMGFSSHTPSVSNRILDTGLVDMMMFSINPAYDFERGDEYGIGATNERFELFRRCKADGIGISVMKPFHVGKLLDAQTSPFGTKLTRNQCIQYTLDRPGVLTVVPGVRSFSDLNELLTYLNTCVAEKDYSVLDGFTEDNIFFQGLARSRIRRTASNGITILMYSVT